MRRTITLNGTIIGLALVTGCGPSVQQLDGPAAPVGAASPSSTAASPAATPPAVRPASAPASGATIPRPSRIASAQPVLGPTALGKIKIGMTVSQAKDSGMIVRYRDGGTACGSSTLRDAPAGAGTVVHSPRRGVVAISAYGTIRTPEGIRIGSSLDQVRRAYTDLTTHAADALNSGNARVWANRNDGDNVAYRMTIRGNKVTELGLEHHDQDCYE